MLFVFLFLYPVRIPNVLLPILDEKIPLPFAFRTASLTFLPLPRAKGAFSRDPRSTGDSTGECRSRTLYFQEYQYDKCVVSEKKWLELSHQKHMATSYSSEYAHNIIASRTANNL